MDLKTESIYRIKQPGQILQSGEHELNLPSGETIVARVEQKQGDSVVLRNERNGTLINASMSGGAEIDSGDLLEMAISENGSGYLLYIMDIVHAGQKTVKQYTRDSLTDVLAALKSNAGLDPKTASFLAQNNVHITPDNIEELKNMARGNSGIAELLSDILTGIGEEQQAPQKQTDAAPQAPVYLSQTQENIVSSEDAYINNKNIMNDGNITGMQAENDGNIMGMQAENTGNAAAQAVPVKTEITAETNAPQESNTADVTGISQQTATEVKLNSSRQKVSYNSNIPVNTTVNGEETAPSIESKPEQPTANMAHTGIKSKNEEAGQTPAKGYIPEEPSADNPASLNVSSKTGNTAQVLEKAGVQNGQQINKDNKQGIQAKAKTAIDNTVSGLDLKSKEGSRKLIEQRIKDIFIKPYEQTGEQIKKAVLDIPGKLNMLKLLLDRTDSNDKERYMDKAEQAQKQLQLGAGFNRFYYIELPFMAQNGDPKKAELYVQKNAGRKKKENEPDSVVLISLDTKNIGLIETLIKAKKDSISLEFRLERKELQQEVRKYDKALAKSMKEAGYTLSGFSVTGLETKTTVMNADKLFSDGGMVRTGKIDVQI